LFGEGYNLKLIKMVNKEVCFSDLIGKTLVKIETKNDKEIIFTCDDGKKYLMYHQRDCCEDVTIDEINGDTQDLIGSPILRAEEKTNSGEDAETTYTWTFFDLATIKGFVQIKWFGSSNGYYSESVSFELAS